ncbi:MAG: hypothetical protein ACI80V_002420 [Rhodothermales bacterium]|jgi:hypothetical protein
MDALRYRLPLLALIVFLVCAPPVSAQTFTRITEGPVVADGGHSFGHSWSDWDGDGWLDLMVNNDVAGEPSFFYRNLGDGTFERATPMDAVGPSASSTWGD